MILGARTTEQLADNLGAATLMLDADEIAPAERGQRPAAGDYPYGKGGINQRHRKIEGGR